MPNAIIYNPLIKKGFQEIADTGSIEADITQLQTDVTTLQSKKIDKCSTVDDVAALPFGTLFQWQGETNATFMFGYFYRQISQQITIPANSTFIKYDSVYPTITENNYTFAPDNYYIIEDNTPLAGSSFFSYNFWYHTANQNIVFLTTTYSHYVGQLCWDNQNYCYYTVTAVTSNSITLSNGDTINTNSGGAEPVRYLYKCENANGDIFYMIKGVANRFAVVHYQINGNTFTVIDWFMAKVYTSTTTNPVTIGADVYKQTNAQPLQLRVNNNKVIYTLSDGITQKTLVSTDDISDTEIDYTPDESALKNGLPTTAPISDIATLLNSLAISYNIGTTDTYVFFADATDYYTSTTSVEQCGFIGLVCSYRGGGNMGISVSLTMTALISRNTLYYLAYSANDNKLVPILAQYNNRYYLGLKFASGLSRSITFIGKRYGFLSTPITATNNVTDIITGTKYT